MGLAEAVVVVVAAAGPLLLLLSLLRGRAEERSLIRLVKAPLSEPLLVVMPARNEAARIGPTLDALLQDPSPELRVVVVDDSSPDGTADVVRARGDARVSVVPSVDGAGFGKPRALHHAIATHDHGNAVVVVDADVEVAAGTLGGLVNVLRRAPHGGHAAVSVVPRLDNRSLVEELLVPAFVTAVAATHPPSRVGETGFLNGQLLLLDREALDDVGGFAAVQHTVLEDVALGRLLVAKQHKLALVDARDDVKTRMYDSLAGIVAGFGKNARALHEGKLVPLALLLVTTSWAPWIALAAAAVGAEAATAFCSVCVACAVSFSCVNRWRVRSRWWMGAFSPLVQLVVAFVYLKAAIVRRGSWRGRTFST